MSDPKFPGLEGIPPFLSYSYRQACQKHSRILNCTIFFVFDNAPFASVLLNYYLGQSKPFAVYRKIYWV